MSALAGKVVVITGASSGIGRATAVEFATRRSNVVVAARRGDALDETVRLCLAAGGDAFAVVADVTNEREVNELADAAFRRYGRIDIWVNNAGTTLFARLDEGPFDEHRRVIETNLFGAMLCARAVMPRFRSQRAGVLINVGSILSKVGQPFVPSYVISKFGLRGLSEALRAEFASERAVHVCTVFPYAVDTPHFESGGNRLGLEARPLPPIQTPEKVARAIVDVARRPRRERHVPRSAALGLALHAIVPRFVEKLLLHALSEWHFGTSRERDPRGSLYEPKPEPAQTRGTRPPRIGTFALARWVLKSLPRVVGNSAPRRQLP